MESPGKRKTIDSELCPENANQHGYVWIRDIPYDLDWSEGDIPYLLTTEGYKLGRSVTYRIDIFVGLYAPIVRNNVLSY